MELLVKEKLAVNRPCPRCHGHAMSRIEQDEEGDGGYDHCYACGRSFGRVLPGIDPKKGHEDLSIMSDTGCRQATELLGKQSSCWECPFEDCKVDHWADAQWHMVDTISPKIIAAHKAGTNNKEIARILHIGTPRVRRVIASLV